MTKGEGESKAIAEGDGLPGLGDLLGDGAPRPLPDLALFRIRGLHTVLLTEGLPEAQLLHRRARDTLCGALEAAETVLRVGPLLAVAGAAAPVGLARARSRQLALNLARALRHPHGLTVACALFPSREVARLLRAGPTPES